jgi:hypothetical protein
LKGYRHSPSLLRGKAGGNAEMHLLKKIKIEIMPTTFTLLKRKKRKWISYSYSACHYDKIVIVVMRCPVLNGEIQIHLSWLHKIVDA